MIPVALVGLISRIHVPHSLADWNIFRRRSHYSPLDQDDTGVLLDDYENEEDSDADEL